MTFCPLPGLSNAILPSNFCAFELPLTGLSRARSLLTFPSHNAKDEATTTFLVLERGKSAVTMIYDQNGDGIPESSQLVVVQAGLNHGIAIDPSYSFLYASTDSTVYRWPLTMDVNPNNLINQNWTSIFLNLASTSSVPPEEVIVNMNANGPDDTTNRAGNHVTRTLLLDELGRLYVSVGSVGNIDIDSYRSRIRRFDLTQTTTTTTNLPLDFTTGRVFADGVRNEVGLALDKYNVLWGVENGPDNLQRDDLGGRITNDNPGEEVHRFGPTNSTDEETRHYGYPYCWTEYQLDANVGQGRGTVWAWPSFLANGVVTDESCRTDYATAELVVQAHSAPLGITFYHYRNVTERPAVCTTQGGGAFPQIMDGYAFVAFHGSWNRDIPTGYKVVYIPMDGQGRVQQPPTVVDLLAHAGSGAKWPDGFRPVDVAFDACGRLLVSSDGSGNRGSKIVRIEYHGNETSEELNSPPVVPPPTFPTWVPSGVRYILPLWPRDVFRTAPFIILWLT
jgi:glucose/arabinose dehydrogenase